MKITTLDIDRNFTKQADPEEAGDAFVSHVVGYANGKSLCACIAIEWHYGTPFVVPGVVSFDSRHLKSVLAAATRHLKMMY